MIKTPKYFLSRSLIFSVALATLTTSASADPCGIEEALIAKGKEIRLSVGVPKRDQSFLSGLGLTLHKGLFGTKYVKASELLKVLEQNGCDADLMAWIIRKSKKVQTDSEGTSGGSNGGTEGSGGGNTL